MEQKEHGRLEDSLQEETTDQEDLDNTEHPEDLNSFRESESQEQ